MQTRPYPPAHHGLVELGVDLLVASEKPAFIWGLYAVVVAFAAILVLWNPVWVRAERDPEELARHMRKLQRRLRLVHVASDA